MKKPIIKKVFCSIKGFVGAIIKSFANTTKSLGNAIIGSENVESFYKGYKSVTTGGFHDISGEKKKQCEEEKRRIQNKELAQAIANALREQDEENENTL